MDIQAGDNIGLTAASINVAIRGVSTTNVGVRGESQGNDGVQGQSHHTDHSGVVGINEAGNGFGVFGISNGGIGVCGDSRGNDAVQGRSHDKGHSGVAGFNDAQGVGVFGRSDGGRAGWFIGDVEVTRDLKVTRNLNVGGDINVGGDLLLVNGDIAERFAVESSAECNPGMVMSIGADGTLVPCSQQYDKRVVGVISGAGTLRPAVTLRHSSCSDRNAVVALVGTVYCLADADKAPIELGDLLTASDKRGHAMKAIDPQKSFGAVIGKALAPLANGSGLILILVALQ